MSRILHDTGTHSGNSGLQGQVKVKLGNRKVGIKVTEGESRKVDEPIEQVSQKSKELRTETKASVKLSEGTKLTERQQCTGNFQRSHSSSRINPRSSLELSGPDQNVFPFLVAAAGTG